MIQEPLEIDTKSFRLDLLEAIVKQFVVQFKKPLRSVQTRDQDSLSAEKASGEEDGITCWQSLLEALTLLYKNKPDAAVEWWTDNDLHQFVRAAADVWHPKFIIMFFDFVASISCGQRSADLAHSVLDNESQFSLGNITWQVFFTTLNSYLDKLTQKDVAYEMSQIEVDLMIKFLNLVSIVVGHSVRARRSLAESRTLRPMDGLFIFLVCKLPVELKAAVLDAISSFVQAPLDGFDTSEYIWSYFYKSAILPIIENEQNASPPANNTSFMNEVKFNVSSGLAYDIREIECLYRTYPETKAFLKLFQNLLAASKEVGRPFGTELTHSNSQLGLIYSYLEFIIVEIFLKLDERTFANPDEKWEIGNACIEIFLLCVTELDISGVLAYIVDAGAENTTFKPALNPQLSPLDLFCAHPGFSVIKHLLRGGKFTSSLFRIISFTNSDKLCCKSAHQCVFGCLKLLLFGLKNQRAILETILPAMIDLKFSVDTNLFSTVTGIDNLLASRKEAVISIIENIISGSESTALISVFIVIELSQSSVFDSKSNYDNVMTNSRLVGYIDRSPIKETIIEGFCSRIDVEGVEEICEAVTDLVADPDPCNSPHSLGHTIKLAILDLLLTEIRLNCSGLALYILGLSGQSQRERSISNRSCLNLIVRQLGENLSNGQYHQPLYSEKCFQLLYFLASDSKTSDTVLRFLRNDHDFFYRHLDNFSPVDDPGQNLEDASESFVASLHHTSWLLKIVALELHVTASSGQRSSSQRILGLLVRSNTLSALDNNEDISSGTARNLSQPIIKVVDIVQKINFSDLQLPPLVLTGTKFAQLQLGDFMKLDSRGTEVFDILGLYWALGSHFNYLIRSDPNLNLNDRHQMEETAKMILDTVVKKNKVQKVLHARFCCALAWFSLIRITVKDYFDLLSYDVREQRLSQLLVSLLQQVNRSSTSASIGTIASEAVLSLVSRLKQDKVANRNSASTEILSAEQSISYQNFTIQGVINGIMSPGSSTAMRGNYYSSLVSFLNFIRPETSKKARKNVFFDTVSLIFKQSTRFWEIICRDSVEGELIWRTVAFSTLSSICNIMNWSFTHTNTKGIHPFLDFLTKRNFLGFFIETLTTEDDKALQSIIDNRSSINRINQGTDEAQYCFSTKISFLLALAGSTSGAEKMLEYGIIEALSRLGFIKVLPPSNERSQSMFDRHSHEIYYSLVTSVFEVIMALVSTYPKGHPLVNQKLAEFYSLNGTAIISMMRSHERLDLLILKNIKVLTALICWSGTKNLSMSVAYPASTQNSIPNALISILRVFSNSKWVQRIVPINELETLKAQAVSPFIIGGSKKSIFIEECSQLGDEISRNIIMYFSDANLSYFGRDYLN